MENSLKQKLHEHTYIIGSLFNTHNIASICSWELWTYRLFVYKLHSISKSITLLPVRSNAPCSIRTCPHTVSQIIYPQDAHAPLAHILAGFCREDVFAVQRLDYDAIRTSVTSVTDGLTDVENASTANQTPGGQRR